MEAFGGLFFLLFALLAAAAIGLGWWAQHQRYRRLEEWSASLGWHVQRSAPQLVGRWRGNPFHLGSSRHAGPLAYGTFEGREAAVFEYRYSTGSGKNRSTTVLTVTMLGLPAALPDLEITPEGLGAKIAKALGGQDIQFESEAFNRAWRVEGAHLPSAHGVVHPRMMELLMVGPREPLRIEGADIWTWTTGGVQPDHALPRLARLAAVAGAVPRHVWQDWGYDPGDGVRRASNPKG